MSDIMLQEAADEFVRALAANPVVSELQAAKASMEADEALSALRDQYARMVEQFQIKQFDGTLVQEDISKLRKVYSGVTAHPANVRFIEARDDALELLNNCNQAMGNLLGFDFSATAAPAASC